MRKLVTALVFGASFAPFHLSAQEVRLNAPEADEDLRTALSNASLSLSLIEDGAESPQDFVAAARADYRRLLTGLYSQGYYSGTISIILDGVEASRIDPLVPRTSVGEIVLNVTPGPKFIFGRADIAPVANGTELPEAFAVGETARSAVVGTAESAVITGWRNAGHPLAETASQSITARHPDKELDASVVVDPGPLLEFGPTTITGNERVRTERIREIANLPSGQYDPAEITRAETNLRRTGAFSSAAFTESEFAVDGTLPLTLNIAEQKPRRIGAGIEFGSVEGLTLSGYWMHRNLLGGAENLRFDGEVTGLSGGNGGLDYTLGATFLRPATFNSENDFYTNASISQLDQPDFFEQQANIEAGIIRRLGENVEVQYGIGYLGGETTDDLGTRSFSLVYLPVEGTLDRRNDPFDATSGFYANLTISPFAGLGDTGSGARITGDGRVYRSFGENDRLTLAARGQLGSIIGADAADVPSSYLFFSGGGGTVRGQGFQSLDVELDDGSDIGGTSFVGAQLEARFDVTDTIGVVGFYDVGFIGPDTLPFDDGDFHAGAGIGLRYNTGIGPIRLDLGVPASGDDAGESLDVYIGIGQAF